MTSDEIREAFLKYFEDKGHLRVQSSSLIPVGDPTLLLTIAGMNQFKPYFSGQQTPPRQRLTSAQKCFRTPDIDIVGDATHNTLFEMLGNFSIGDYFKNEAIEYALEFLTGKLNLPEEKFYITIHHTDDEAQEIWENIGVPKERIYRFGDEDNWWGPPIHGSEGPCGPCSELHYDFGSDRGCLKNDCAPNCENLMSTGEKCTRFVELWNLVFMQYYHHPDGTREKLPAPSIDTGMGLERATIVMQDVETMYETDIFASLIAQVCSISGHKYGEDLETDYAIRAIAEHTRSSTFLTADGVVPGNEGRGYVLRRVIRRAIRLARKLGLEESFMSPIAESVIVKMKATYPELYNHKEFILSVLKLEEERFQQAFENGFTMLEEAMENSSTLEGDLVFKLWDTYGFPVEMTQEIGAERNITVDMTGFEKEMEAQKNRARSHAQFDGDHARVRLYEELGVGNTNFTGYETLNGKSVVVGLISMGLSVTEVSQGEELQLVLRETPFYAEGGGQVGDGGTIGNSECEIAVHDTKEVIPGLIVHYGILSKGTISIGDTVQSHVDPIRRDDTARNHTATHMLHAALRHVLGPHVRQAGSLVTASRLRFDFSHIKAVTPEEMWQVQFLVNEKIRHNAEISRSEDTYSGAIEKGALAFFGDKYGDTVRLVEIANGETFSFEVCGGTHVNQTGEVGAVYILGESSIGAGMRRIEAISGREAERLVWQNMQRDSRIADILQTAPSDIEERVIAISEQISSANNQIQQLERQMSALAATALLDEVQIVNEIKVLISVTEDPTVELLRSTGDWLRDKLGTGVVAIGSIVNGNPMVVCMITPDLVEKGMNAAHMVQEVAKIIGGGGGGRPESAQAGGKDSNKLREALSIVPGMISDLSGGE
ncbi:MAG: alanine--tRNA ligase [Chloroflexota bacterium]|jgi:alanyl-tRNA synthetase|uniref:Alanine--tRNA ligase n=1 Tax=marine metagenome TaxID=408172 RepID=A0A381P1W8_9ZZZZ|nr:alanine--tRNA ligase [Dehalococcoidia bacterium]MCH2312463.1 alanine--tRNA ligase [SAR202 cluster bacterium]MEC7913115.1 alanine--tRNA ligase [Chloroflexota bacterium]MBV46905.1 alanine--tRNA ligase [Dehalococcoidia bacterium]HAT22093.1 alanine--tRNA ligase [Dehalococcoidia bacterium]|tara:strand:- start:3089 stop:5743 length:2655 start_codon:yes stop_codon:yes gene_type:complete